MKKIFLLSVLAFAHKLLAATNEPVKLPVKGGATVPAKGAPKADESKLATDLVEKSEQNVRGDFFEAKMTMEVKRPESTRNLSMKVWSEGLDKSLVKILTPAKDKGTGNLRLKLELWQYLPNIDRIVKIPPSMMLQSWMGSDFTNDDLVKTSSLARDYTHQIVAREKVGHIDAVKIKCTPKNDAPVVWGSIMLWVTEPQGVPLKREFYSERGELLKVMEGSDIKTFGKHTLPTFLTMRDAKKANSQTTLRYEDVVFDRAMPDGLFSQQSLRR